MLRFLSERSSHHLIALDPLCHHRQPLPSAALALPQRHQVLSKPFRDDAGSGLHIPVCSLKCRIFIKNKSTQIKLRYEGTKLQVYSITILSRLATGAPGLQAHSEPLSRLQQLLFEQAPDANDGTSDGVDEVTV